jgi:hypothetical protein
MARPSSPLPAPGLEKDRARRRRRFLRRLREDGQAALEAGIGQLWLAGLEADEILRRARAAVDVERVETERAR